MSLGGVLRSLEVPLGSGGALSSLEVPLGLLDMALCLLEVSLGLWRCL